MTLHLPKVALVLATFSNCRAFQSISIRRITTSVPLSAVKVVKSDEEWKEILRPDRYNVLRREGTEPPWTSPFNDLKEAGTFKCGGCDSPLFTTSTKYESGSGWPSFYSPIDEDAVDLTVDYKLVMPRTEVTCKNCGGHLGHVFEDGPQPTGKRYCMNGVAMDFVSDEEDPDLARNVIKRTESSGQIKQPLMAVIPSLAFDGAVAVLFISSFISKNGSGGLDVFSDGFGVGQLLELIPLGVGAYYAASALQKAVNLVLPEE